MRGIFRSILCFTLTGCATMILVSMAIELQKEFWIRLVRVDSKDVKTVGQLLAVFAEKMKK